MEMEEINRTLPSPIIISKFESHCLSTRYAILPSSLSGGSVGVGGAGGCMQLIDMLGLSARVYFELNRLKEAEEAALLGLGIKEQNNQSQDTQNSQDESGGGKGGKQKKKKEKPPIKNKNNKNNKILKKGVSSSDQQGQSNIEGNDLMRIHCRRVLALLAIESHQDMVLAEFHYKKALEASILLEWPLMEIRIILDLKNKIYLPNNRENESDLMMDKACKKMNLAKTEVISLLS
mmetsp:Transcript_26290/g.34195  ORF Transcript_26290/g.34195 Transcript_26290/m.34195 type:complete len:234 (-) Transcript_26290:3-704(-)